MESSNKPAHRLSPECSLFEALSCLLTQGLPFIPVGEDGPDQRFLSTTALIKAWQAGMPGETPVSSLELASATDLPSETPGADSLINGLPMLLWLKDRGGRFLIVNRGFAESCGQTSPQALIGKTDLDLWPQELAEAYRAEDAEVIATGRPRTRIEQIADRGTPTWFETFKAPVRSSDGQIVGTLGFACDISERMRQQAAAQHSQKQLAYVLATIGEGVWDWDLATDQVTHNPRWCQMLGLDEQNLNHPAGDFLTLVHDDDRNARATAINTCLGGAGSYRAEYRLRHADGHYLWVRDQGNVVEYGEHGQPLRMVGSIADIHAARSTALACRKARRATSRFSTTCAR